MANVRGERRREELEGDEELFMVEKRRRSGKKWWGKKLFGLLVDEPIGTDLGNPRSGSSPGGPSASRGFVIHPDNWWYAVAWTHFILLWAIYSSFFTPMEFAFFRGLPQKLFLLDIAGQFAFLLDIVVQFFVAYRDSRSYRLVYNRHLIAIRYLKSRFVVDFLGCLPLDAIYKVFGRKEPVRYLLWIRLSRGRRVTEFFEKLEKDIRINYLFTRILKLFVVEVYWTHTAACIFYYLATTMPASQEGYTWIGSLQMGAYRYSHFRDIDLWKRYITSLYFAIITMATVGYGDIHAVNIREMIFVMIYVSFDMILGAYLVGNMTALIVKGSSTEKFRDKMTDLLKYLNINNLETGISTEVKRHLRLRYDHGDTEAAILQDIPASIRTKIFQRLYEPHIKGVPLFRGCSSEFIKQMAIKVHEEFFLPGEVIIEKGHIVDQLYIVCHGDLEIIRGENDTDETPVHLQAHDSFGEVSFLCNNPQSYTVQVRDLSRILRVDKQSFLEILESCFADGRIILNNLLEGKDTNFRAKLLESDFMLYIIKSESELAARLNCAVYDGDLCRLKRLIGAGANPSKTDYYGRSPLHTAVCKGYEEITHFLIEKGVDVNILDKCGNTPLFEAIKHGHDVVASILVTAGASLEIEDIGCFLCATVAKRDSALLKRILDHGINPNAKDYDYRTPLHIAASEGLYSTAKLLVEAGAVVFSKDRWGHSPLDEARVGGNKSLIQLLDDAKTSQMSGLGDNPLQLQGGMQRRKCTVFPFHPWDPEGKRKQGIVLWVPDTMDELVKVAVEQLKTSRYCILSEHGGEIVDVSLISNDQNLFLVKESKYK